MRLRETIKPPTRFDCEDYYTPGSQRSLRNRIHSSPRFIDFNPNLPPAAFPSLDRPRADCEKNNGIQGKENWPPYTKEAKQVGSKGIEPRNGQIGAGGESEVEFENFTIEEIENQAASNGPLNKIYVRNMAIMAAISESESEDLNMSDSDIGEEVTDDTSVTDGAPNPIDDPKDQPQKANPRWSELSPKMHVEIVGNLLEHHSYYAVCRMLGLSTEEREQVQELFANRNKQIRLENRRLMNMRDKQMRALKRIDFSTLRRSQVPHELVLERMSEGCSHILRESIKDDNQMCQYGDFKAARQFLHLRGIDRSYAGDWSNTMVSLRALEHESEPEIFEWKEHVKPIPDPTTEEEPAAITPTPCPNPGKGANMERLSFINGAGEALDTVDPRELVKRKGDLFATPRWLIKDQREFRKRRVEQLQRDHEEHRTPRRSGLVCLKIGTEQAAQIANSDPSYLDQNKVFYPAFALPRGRESPEFVRPDQLHPSPIIDRPPFHSLSPSTKRAGPSPRRPVQRTLGGNWSYNSVEHVPKSQVTPAYIVRQKLEDAKLEAVKGKTVREYCEDAATFSQLRQTRLATYTQQPLPTSYRAQTQESTLTPTVSEYEAFTKDILNLSSSPTSDNMTTPTQPAPVISKPTKAPKDEHSSDEEPEADDCDEMDLDCEDEMVLLPNGAASNN